MKYLFLVITLAFSICSCVKDKPNPETHTLPQPQQHGVVVLNEGAYGNNNAELSFIEFSSSTISNNIFQTANHKSLGDVANSITLINGSYYIAVNNSNKIVVVGETGFQETAIISQVSFPRQIVQINSQKAYVSSLYTASVFVIDLQTNTLQKTITTDFPNTENMLLSGKYIWCTNWDTASNLLYKINTETDLIEERIVLPGRSSHDITMDRNGKLWVLSGNKYKNKISYLCCVDPVSNAVLKTFPFNVVSDPFRLQMNKTKDTLYFIQVNYNGSQAWNGVYRMCITDPALPVDAWIPAAQNSYFWGLGVDTLNNEIYVSDPKGFTQQSTLQRYSAQGILLGKYQAGIGANSFLFR